MALSEAEELELLELEEAEAQAGGETSPGDSPTQPQSPPESKTRRFMRGVANALPTAGGIGGGIAGGIGGTVAGFGVGGVPGAVGGAGIGAAGGTAAKQLILRSLGDTEGVPQTSGEAAKEIGIKGATDAALTLAGGTILGAGGRGLRLAKDLIRKPGAIEVAQTGKEAILKAGERGAERLASARAAKEAAKKGLIEAEEKAGLHFESTPDFEVLLRDPKRMAEFSQKIGRLAKQTPEALAQSVPSEQLQLFRKVAQEGGKVSNLSDIAKSQLRQGKDVFTQALGKSEKGIGEALGSFRDADKVVAEIPGQIKRNLIATKRFNEKQLLDAKSLDRKRKVIKGLAKGAALYLGAKSIF